MSDPYYADVKQWKMDYDRREMVLFANHRIPKTCVCGGPITLATDDKEKSYYECIEYEDDGLHIRHPCFHAIKEELEELKKKVAEEASRRMNVEDEMKKMREDIKLLKELCIEVRNDDGLHSRQRCFDAIEEELLELKKEVAEEHVTQGVVYKRDMDELVYSPGVQEVVYMQNSVHRGRQGVVYRHDIDEHGVIMYTMLYKVWCTDLI
ncbi:hypothetical protein Bca52824_039341 [Brassica carinata]|uniref:Uncharacterized protein n=1 Tax=Brassica carinata TaxID=52824 RepID=A0A8X7RRC2_BRACI|nr:hypothetical protein Bca52824_039341 [Brassica carinata]